LFKFRREVYLDNNATTPVRKEVRRKINATLKNCYGNPSSLYKNARNSAEILEDARKIVSLSLNVSSTEIIFTGSASEANNTVIKTIFELNNSKKNKIISSPIEHPSVISVLEYLKTRGAEIEYCRIDKFGTIDINALEKQIDNNTALVICMLANNETGIIQNIKAISKVTKTKGVYLLSDCVQALGKIPVDLKDLDVDYAVFSAHKIYGPKGIGLLYVRNNCPIQPLIHGGHQERGIRAGTENTHNIAGFAEACKFIPQMLAENSNLKKLTLSFAGKLKQINSDLIINTLFEKSLPNTLSVTFPGINNAVFMALLDYYGISVAAGSACNTQDDRPSHVLSALGISAEYSRNTLRFSLGHSTSEKDIEYVLSVIKNYFKDQSFPVTIISPRQLNENMLFDENNYILDVRYWHDRKLLKSLPNSYEANPSFIKKNFHILPNDKQIIVICQSGYDGPFVSLFLKSKGFKNVAFVFAGLIAWKLYNSDLYSKYAGLNIKNLITENKFAK